MSVSIGLLEEMILLIVLKEHEINGAAIVRAYESTFGKSISLPAVVVVLKRLERKGILESRLGEKLAERGGKRRKIYRATQTGYQLAAEIQNSRNEIWSAIPQFSK